jgi:nicotinamide-nucleotide amidase
VGTISLNFICLNLKLTHCRKNTNMEKHLYQLAQTLGEHLRRNQQTLSTAESCTGGWIAKALTDIPGSSAWFDCGFVTYSNQAKQRLLNVPEAILASHGAVSAATAQAMLQGALANSTADRAIAVTGIAGPDGGSEQKPVGTVYIGWQQRGQAPRISHQLFSGDRDAVRLQTVVCALEGCLGDF